jgi:hypothetical protein
MEHTPKSWLWPDTLAPKPSTLRDEHNATANAYAALREVNAELVAALTDAEFLLRKVGINPKEAEAVAYSLKRSATDARAALARAAEVSK